MPLPAAALGQAVTVAAAVLLVSPLLPFSSAQGCGGSITNAPATISSPNFPRDYPSNANCQWVVRAPAGRSVQISVVKFSLGGFLDVLRILDGVNATCDTPLISYTIYDKPAGRILLLGRNVTVAFSSVDSMRSSGFRLSVSFVTATNGGSATTSSATATTPSNFGCGGSLTGSGRLASPNYPALYRPNTLCVWRLNSTESQSITLRVVNLKLESPWDTVRVYLSASPGANDLPAAQFTGTAAEVTKTFNGSSTVTVVFASDESVQLSGFEVFFYSNATNATYTAAPASILPRPDVCGVPSVSGDAKISDDNSRIVGGNSAKQQAWPWQAQLAFRGRFICGGSIISSQWVVTAAHCILQLSPKLFTISLGKYNQGTTDSTLKRITASKIIVHPGYDKVADDSDIALIKLSQSVVFNSAIKPICLPVTDVPPGTSCYVTGWGETEGTGTDSVLRQAEVPVLSRSCCQKYLLNSFTKNMTCAGYITGGKDTCQGDSGGPLVCRVNGVFWLYGITSWGVGCADPYWPGVYTRVTGFNDWITTTVAKN